MLRLLLIPRSPMGLLIRFAALFAFVYWVPILLANALQSLWELGLAGFIIVQMQIAEHIHWLEIFVTQERGLL